MKRTSTWYRWLGVGLLGLLPAVASWAEPYSILNPRETRLALVGEQLAELHRHVRLYFDPGFADAQFSSEQEIGGRKLRLLDRYYVLTSLNDEAYPYYHREFVVERRQAVAVIDDYVKSGFERFDSEEEDDDFVLIEPKKLSTAASVSSPSQTKLPVEQDQRPKVALSAAGIKLRFERQVRITLREAAHQICLRERCGQQMCKGLIASKEHFDAQRHAFILTSLVCDDEPTPYSSQTGANALAMDVVRAFGDLNRRAEQGLTRASGRVEPLAAQEEGAATSNSGWFEQVKAGVVSCQADLDKIAGIGLGIGSDIGRALSTDFWRRDLNDWSTYIPLTYLGTVVQAGASSVVTRAYELYKKPAGQGHYLEQLPDHAYAHLQRGEHFFTPEQKGVINHWIAEAREGLKRLADARQAKKEQGDEEAAVRLPSFAMLEASKAEEESEEARAKRFELAQTLRALREFLRMPTDTHRVKKEEVTARFEAADHGGSMKFLDDLHGRAITMATNSWKGPQQQQKKIMIAASGPGTGKTYGIHDMALWADLPICTLAAEKFNKMEIPAGKTAFNLIEDWVRTCLQEQFRVHIKRSNAQGQAYSHRQPVVNGILFFDDWHYALQETGLLGKDAKSRENFFGLLKNIVDPTQESPLLVDLAPGRRFPVNLSRVDVVITINEIADEFSPEKGEPHFLTRVAVLKDPYPDPEDRHRIARGKLDELQEAVASLRKVADEQVWERYRQALSEVAAADIHYYERKFGGKLGIRGFGELLAQFVGHVSTRIANGDALEEAAELGGAAGFDLKGAMARIPDYHKKIDKNLSEQEDLQVLEGVIDDLRQGLGKLQEFEQTAVRTLIEKAGQEAELANRKRLVADAQFLRNSFTKRVTLPDADRLGESLERLFNYLQAQDDQLSEIDQFTPLADIAESIHKRLWQGRKADVRPQSNRLIRVSYSDPSAYDPGLFKTMAEALGGLPVCILNAGQKIVSEPADLWNIADMPPHQDGTRVGRYLRSGHDLELAEFPGKRFSTLQEKISALGTDYIVAYPDSGFAGEVYALARESVRSIEERVKSSGSYRGISIPSEAYRKLAIPSFSSEAIRQGLSELTNRQITLWDHCLEEFANRDSAAEGFIVVPFTTTLRRSLEAWYKRLPDKLRSFGPVEAFEGYLARSLNSEGLTLASGKRADLRRNTVFLLYADGLPAGLDLSHLGRLTLDYSVSPPPMSGRKVRAEQLLASGLSEQGEPAEARAARMENLGMEEQAAFAALIAFDRTQAEEADHYKVGALGLWPLEDAVEDFLQRVASAQDPYFPLAESIAFPSLEGFTSIWQGLYREAMTPVEAAKERIRQEQEAAEEAAARKAEEELAQKEKEAKEATKAKEEEAKPATGLVED